MWQRRRAVGIRRRRNTTPGAPHAGRLRRLPIITAAASGTVARAYGSGEDCNNGSETFPRRREICTQIAYSTTQDLSRSVHLSDIYTLQRLAYEQPRQYHVQVIKLFCAFVRHPTAYDGTEAKNDTGEAAVSASTRGHVHGRPRLREDIQAIMKVIGSRGESSIALERSENFVIDLNGADLSYAKLAGANLSNADLSFTTLYRADFSGRQIPPSNPLPLGHPQNELWDPTSSNVIRFSANLSGANLSYANLSRAWIMAVDLSSARLVEADLSWSRLFLAKLSKANLFEANMSKASIQRADLADANLAGSNMSRAMLTGAMLRGTNFYQARLRDCQSI